MDETKLVVVVDEAVLVLFVDGIVTVFVVVPSDLRDGVFWVLAVNVKTLELVEVEGKTLVLLLVPVLASLVELTANEAVWEEPGVEDIDGFAVESDIELVMDVSLDVSVDDVLEGASELAVPETVPLLLPVPLAVSVLCVRLVVDEEPNAVPAETDTKLGIVV